jgi:hypothetical protein
MKTNIHFLIISRSILLRVIFFLTNVVEEIKHIFCSIFFEHRALHEIMWKNLVEPGRLRMTIWRMRIACLYLRLQTHTQYVIRFVSPLRQWLHERASCYVTRRLPAMISPESATPSNISTCSFCSNMWIWWNQRDALFIQFIENPEPLHVSSITCLSSGGAAQTALGILRAYNVSRLWHDCTANVAQPTDITRTQYTKCHLFSTSWGLARNARNM